MIARRTRITHRPAHVGMIAGRAAINRADAAARLCSRSRLPLLLLLLLLLGATSPVWAAVPAHAPEAPFSAPALRGPMALPPTRVMVLGMWHLDGADPAFRTAWLAPVLCRLRTYRPDVVLTEAMPGEQVMGLEAYKAYHGDADSYAGPTPAIAHDAQAAVHLGPAEALVQADALAASRPTMPAQRRRLAALFAAAAEPYSAVVQWMRLPANERTAADGITPALAKRLAYLLTARSELASIAARTAADVGLERVVGAGDHSSDVARPTDAAFDAAVAASPGQKTVFNHEAPVFKPYAADRTTLATEAEVMQRLRWANSDRFGRLDADAQWFSQLRSATMGRVGRQSVAAWEAQNLHMATVVREATAAIPGGRALLVVGAAHKPFIESYLRALSDIEVVPSAPMLDARPAGCPG